MVSVKSSLTANTFRGSLTAASPLPAYCSSINDYRVTMACTDEQVSEFVEDSINLLVKVQIDIEKSFPWTAMNAGA